MATVTRAVRPVELEEAIARLLTVGTYVSIALLAVGVLLMLGHGISPLARGFPALDVARIPSDVVALRPEGFLWLGLVAVIATPTARVVASLLGFLVRRELLMAAVSVAILVVIALSVVLAIVTES